MTSPAPAAARQLRVLISVRPFRGHLHPFIPLARAFRRAGHQVAVATAEDIAAIVTGAALPWLPAGHNPGQLAWAFPDEDPDYGYEAVGIKLADLLDIAVEHFPPDVIIREYTDLAPAIAAELTGAVSVLYGLGHFAPADVWRGLKADETIAALRHDYGLAEDPELDCLYRGLYLSVLPRAFEGRHNLPASAVQRMRYVPWDGADSARLAPAPPPAPAGSDAGRPTVLVTLGTVYNTHTSLFSRFLEALAVEPVNVICTLGTGADESLTQDAPANVRFEEYLPHSSILPRCQAMLCHAGFNTVLGSLRAGIPLVCVPVGSDQEYNAEACVAEGLGLMLTDEEASPERIRAAVRRVLSEPSFSARAAAFRQDMIRRPDFPVAIRRIEALAAARAPGSRIGAG